MFLHVLLQIRLLSIAFAAILANVRLEVFALLVLWYVFEQRGFVAKALVARVALVRFVRLVTPRVRLQVAELRERFLTAGVSASGSGKCESNTKKKLIIIFKVVNNFFFP